MTARRPKKVEEPENRHAFFNASAADRWMSCTASVVVDVSHLPERSSSYADHGTFLHSVAEECLREKKNPITVEVLDDPIHSMFDADAEMVQVYLDYIRSKTGAKFHEILVEFVPGCGGTVDTLIFDQVGRSLEVVDFKSGSGVRVSPIDNTQLIIYALGAMKRYSALYNVEKFKLTIVQPALENVASWTLTSAQLIMRGVKIDAVVTQIKEGDVEFVPGEKSCRWCDARTVCPALQGEAQKAARQDFAGTEADKERLLGDSSRNRLDLTWAEKLKLATIASAWCKAIEDEAKRLLLSGDEKIPGFKVVEGRRSRKWISQARAFRFLRKTWGIGDDELYKKTPVTPAAAEDFAKGDEDRSKTELKKFIETTPGPPTVVPEDDSRKELTKRDLAARDFEGTEADKET